MTAPGRASLYTPEILGLAVTLAEYPLDPAAPLQASVRSRTCGSTLLLSLDDDRMGLRVTACAIGQAAAAIFARGWSAAQAETIAETLAAIEAWLGREGTRPEWPGLAMLEPARAFPARHEAILLPWRAARAALCNRPAGS